MKSPQVDHKEAEGDAGITVFSKSRLRRLETMPETPSTFYKNNPSLFLGETKKKVLIKSVSMSHETYKQYKSKNNCESPSQRMARKSNHEFVNNMSNRSYDNIIAYGWSHLKVLSQAKDELYFSINLGRAKNFLMIEVTEGTGAKALAQQYQIQLLETMQLFQQLNKQVVQKSIQKTIKKIFGKSKLQKIKTRLSMVSLIVKEDEIIVGGIGDLSVLCFTKDQQLINANEANYELLNDRIKFQRFFKKVRNNDIKQRAQNRNRKYNLLSYKYSFHQFEQSEEEEINQIKLRSIKSSNIVWIGIFSKNIIKNCPKHYLKQCINKEFSLSSSNYHYNQVAKQSSNKIVNSLVNKNVAKNMASIVIFIQEYPILKQVSDRKSTPSNRLATFDNRSRQAKEVKPTQPKLFQYIGNRSSFVKCSTPANKKIKTTAPIFQQK